jgi:hypothetical protein
LVVTYVLYCTGQYSQFTQLYIVSTEDSAVSSQVSISRIYDKAVGTGLVDTYEQVSTVSTDST